MTIKQLKSLIQNLPDSMQVFMDERLTEFKYGLVNSAETKEIDFIAELSEECTAKEIVFVLSED